MRKENGAIYFALSDVMNDAASKCQPATLMSAVVVHLDMPRPRGEHLEERIRAQ
jgi:hypothetical protein